MDRTPNAEQAKIISDLENNILLLAGAGTGKTFTIANRVANIIASGRAKAEEILCLTFTIKACEEMKTDIVGYADAVAKDVLVKTIHGFCHRIVAEESRRTGEKYSDPTVCDEVDQEEILKRILSTGYGLWETETLLRSKGLPYTAAELSGLPVCRRKGSQEVFWVVEPPEPPEPPETPAKRLLNAKGELFPYREEEIEEATGLSPLSEREFFIFRKKSALRDLVSVVKHVREERGMYSINEEEDYSRAFRYLKENRREEYDRLVSCSVKYVGYTHDAEFETALNGYAGRWIVEYDRYLSRSNRLDFDDLILQAKACLEREDVRARWEKRFKYIIVDEMQDTSRLEYSVLKKIFSNNKIMLCGDFFQTIYEWRGSKPNEVLGGYVAEFSPKTYMLSENYRSTKILARAAFGYLKKTYPELVGKYCPEELTINSGNEGEKILCYAFDNREEEAMRIYKYIAQSKDRAGNGLCVMARSNKYIADLVKYFERFGEESGERERLKFFTVEENYSFFKKPVVKDVLAVFRLLLDGNDQVCMERLAEKYVRGVGVKTLNTLRGYEELGVSVSSFIDPKLYLRGDPYLDLIEAYRGGNVVVYDTETTGLDLASDQIVQLSAIRLNGDGEISATLDLMIEPTVPIGAEAQKTHGFDLDYIRSHGGKTAKEGLEIFSEFVKGAVLVGHNSVRFDAPLIRRQLKENGLPELDTVAEYDTMTIAKQFHGKLPDFKLATLCLYYGVTNESAHNALGDITATGKCLTRMIEEDIIPTATERQRVCASYKEKFEKFYAFIRELKGRMKEERPTELVARIIEGMLLERRYTAFSDRNAMREIVESMDTEEETEPFLRDYLLNASLSGSQMDLIIKKSGRIPVITVHQAKGCEFDTVILAGVDENHFPSFAARQGGNEDEEKKVFYVAITRAKRRLVLTRSLGEGRYAARESPYFWNIPADCVSVNANWDKYEER